MHRSNGSSWIWSRCILMSVFIVLYMSSTVDAQTPPKYDASTETTMTGTVEDLRLPSKGHEKEIVHLVMKDGDRTVDIYLCPKAFMDDMGVAFNKGDEIAFTGSKITQG